MSADLLPALRAAIAAHAAVTSELAAYAASYPIFTRRPIPDDAPALVVIIGPVIESGRADGIDDQRPILTHDISVYGPNGAAGTQDAYRAVERIAFAIQQLFHRRPEEVQVAGWQTIDVTARGPSPAPVDDEQTVGRRVEVTSRLARAGI